MKNVASVFGIFVFCVQYVVASESPPPLPRDNRAYRSKPKDSISDKRIKISELKPCISKAFCEVNSVTDQPTYETNDDFFVILRRFKKFIDDEERDLSESQENSESSEEGDSYENSSQAYLPPPRGIPPYSYRRGKALTRNGTFVPRPPLKKKSKPKRPTILKGLLRSNRTLDLDLLLKNSTELPKKLTAAEKSLIGRKTRELNVVEDLAALIKISAEIGQALKSPRRCRKLFKKCRMSYQEIIAIFSKTKELSKSREDLDEFPSTAASSTTTEREATKRTTSTTTSTTPRPESAYDEFESETDDSKSNESVNREHKSRHEFSYEDIDYVADTEIKPVNTYSLFTAKEEPQFRYPEDIYDEEPFKQYDKAFPDKKTSIIEYDYNAPKSKVVAQRERESSEESYESYESDEERPAYGYKSKRKHKYSDEEEEDDYHGYTYDRQEPKHKGPSHLYQDDYQVKGYKKTSSKLSEDAYMEDDSYPVIPSSEIYSRDHTPSRKKKHKKGSDRDRHPVKESSESYETSDEEIEREPLYSSYKGNYKISRGKPYKKKVSSSKYEVKKRRKHRNKGHKRHHGHSKGEVADYPQQDDQSLEGSSEEEEREQEPPPPDSKFYQYLKAVNGGKGPDKFPHRMKGGQGVKGQDSDEFYEVVKPSYDEGSWHKSPHSHSYSDGDETIYHDIGYEGGYGGGNDGGGDGSSFWEIGNGKPPDLPGDQGQAVQSSLLGNLFSWFSFGSGSGGQSSQPLGDYTVKLKFGSDNNKKGYRNEEIVGQESREEEEAEREESVEAHEPMREGLFGRRPYWGPPRRGPPPPARYSDYPYSSESQESDEYEDDFSEEDDDEEADISSEKGQQKPSSGDQKNNKKKQGPPPPLVIVPSSKDPYEQANPGYAVITKASAVDGVSSGVDGEKRKKRKKKKKKEEKKDEDSEEEDNSSADEEEDDRQRDGGPVSENPKIGNKNAPSPPSYEKYFTGIFGSAEEMEQPAKMEKEMELAKPKKPSLLLSTFDQIANTFSTSADKIVDWSKEDNPQHRINVPSLASNGAWGNGPYKVPKVKNKSPVSFEWSSEEYYDTK